MHLHINAQGSEMIVIVPTEGAATHFPTGCKLHFSFNGSVAHIFDKETEKNPEY